MELDDRPCHADQVIAHETSGTLVVMSIRTGQYYSLNDLGNRIWQLCDGVRRVADVIEVIGEEYDAPLERIRGDVLTLLTELANERLVELRAAVAPSR
jgi:hypothetical protein